MRPGNHLNLNKNLKSSSLILYCDQESNKTMKIYQVLICEHFKKRIPCSYICLLQQIAKSQRYPIIDRLVVVSLYRALTALPYLYLYSQCPLNLGIWLTMSYLAELNHLTGVAHPGPQLQQTAGPAHNLWARTNDFAFYKEKIINIPYWHMSYHE